MSTRTWIEAAEACEAEAAKWELAGETAYAYAALKLAAQFRARAGVRK